MVDMWENTSFNSLLESDFVELELKAERGFKPFKHIIEVKDGSLDLTGAKQVNLEIDFIKPAHVIFLVENRFSD